MRIFYQNVKKIDASGRCDTIYPMTLLVGDTFHIVRSKKIKYILPLFSFPSSHYCFNYLLVLQEKQVLAFLGRPGLQTDASLCTATGTKPATTSHLTFPGYYLTWLIKEPKEDQATVYQESTYTLF